LKILRFYNFASLAGKCLTTPVFGGFWGFKRLKIVGRHPNPLKGKSLVTTHHLSHKWLKLVQGFDLGGVARKKYNQERTGQDRTTKKSQKRNTSHIAWQSLIFKIKGV